MSKPLIGITTEHWSSSLTVPNRKVQGAMTSYIEAVLGAGGLPVLIPLALQGEDLLALYARLHGVLLPGGEDVDPGQYGAPLHPETGEVDPDRDRMEIELARKAVADQKPLLGICRGAQVFNIALGGTLYQDLPSEYPGVLPHYFRTPEYAPEHPAHSVKVEEDSLLARCLGTPIVQVNSRHHQSVREAALGLVITARAPDGVIEAVELPRHPFALGVQWHPENLQQRLEMKMLFERFVGACQAG
jgi:putative glutamine amidotransferase